MFLIARSPAFTHLIVEKIVAKDFAPIYAIIEVHVQCLLNVHPHSTLKHLNFAPSFITWICANSSCPSCGPTSLDIDSCPMLSSHASIIKNEIPRPPYKR